MSVQELVEDAIKTYKVVIFSKTWCGYSRKAKAIFEQKYPEVYNSEDKIKIFELDKMGEGQEIQNYLYEKTKQSTVPNIFISNEHVGGSDDLQESFRNGRLAKLIEA